MKSLLSLFLIGLACNLFAQNKPATAPIPAPLAVRQLSGIVKDTADNAVPGALVILTSAKDTLRTSTNAEGIFVFRNVKSATFYLTVSSLGYKRKTQRLLKNDALPRIVLDPIILKEESTLLNVVKIDGTPTITYKADTVEYRASDYIVRENATVEDLLKKMEGMEVGTDGSVTHQGQAVAKAKLNGKEFVGGNVASAIQNLPAEIAEKIQIIDDYGDQAARPIAPLEIYFAYLEELETTNDMKAGPTSSG